MYLIDSYKELKKTKINLDDMFEKFLKKYYKNKQIIESNHWLNDKHIEAAKNILKKRSNIMSYQYL